ncbi:hypothetical protein [Spartinivicinus poritis]|uniref:Uncharacterized protein n=1 Tax=Spartinivicinus poritis TaxID=2994640 RepID=A0ABT5UHA2_9GAMM|nr:hypothetical protein [Spartinivicinus sp. A2-2]MDE1465775.1 hypothetical protein [Spartinivicinus sp. A2-2]
MEFIIERLIEDVNFKENGMIKAELKSLEIQGKLKGGVTIDWALFMIQAVIITARKSLNDGQLDLYDVKNLALHNIQSMIMSCPYTNKYYCFIDE